MKGYPSELIEQRAIARTIRIWQTEKIISESKASELLQAHSATLYQPNFFIKIGLFLFTELACCFFSSLIYLIVSPAFNNSTSSFLTFLSVILAICFACALEYVIRKKRFVSVGIDNALLYACLLASCFALVNTLEGSIGTAPLLAILASVLLVATIRYGDFLVGGMTLLLFTAAFIAFFKNYTWGLDYLPFLIMAFAAMMYGILGGLKKRKDSFYYERCFDIVEVITFLLFYAGGNYYVVREGHALLHNIYTTPSPEIALAPLFYFFTLSIPFLYLFGGIQQRNRLLLGIGALTLACSIATYRHYYSVLPIEWALTLSGGLSILLALLLIRQLREPRWGLVDREEKQNGMEIRDLVIGHFVQESIQNRSSQTNDGFGGGDFGGAGSGGTF